MKAVVVDIEGKYAVVLAKNGSFIKVKNDKQYKVGHEVEVSSNKTINLYSFTKIASVAAVVLLSLGIGVGAFAYNSPYAYIDVDINPSVEITTNVFDRIIKIKALNADGEKVIAHGSYKNHKLEDGIDDLLQGAVLEGYLKDNPSQGEGNVETAENAVMFTVSGKNEDKVTEIKKDLQNVVKTKLKASKVKSEVIVEKVSIGRHDKASDLGISPGKMLLLEKLQEAKPDLKAEDYKNAPVRDIIKIIKTEKDKKVKNATPKEDKGKSKTIPENKRNEVKAESEKQKEEKKQVEKNIQKNGSKSNDDNKVKKDLRKENKTKDKKESKGTKGDKDKTKGKSGKAPSPKKYIENTDNADVRDNTNDTYKLNENEKKAKETTKTEINSDKLPDDIIKSNEGTSSEDKSKTEDKSGNGHVKQDKDTGGAGNNSSGPGHKKEKN